MMSFTIKKSVYVPEIPNDVNLAISMIRNLAGTRDLIIQELGRVESWPILLLQANLAADRKNVLIAAGFHGNEYAGVWGIINYLKNGTYFDNVSFLPLVSPFAFKENRRYGKDGKISNQGFCHPEMNLAPSDEGRILTRHAVLLKSLGKDGFLSLHEAPEKNMFYVYAFEKTASPTIIPKELLKMGAAVFGWPEDGTTMQYGGTAKDGIIFNFHDSSFEDFMYESGSPHSIVTETPTSGDLKKRIETNGAVIEKFIGLIQGID
jgi:hypothetical protein